MHQFAALTFSSRLGASLEEPLLMPLHDLSLLIENRNWTEPDSIGAKAIPKQRLFIRFHSNITDQARLDIQDELKYPQ